MWLRGKKITIRALLAAVAIVLSIFEGTVLGGGFFGIPGIKLGLANLAVIIALEITDAPTAFFTAFLKALATFFVSGAVTMLWYSLAGSLLAVLGMWLLLRFAKCFSLIGISAFGGFLSNLGQLIVMMMLSETAEFLYYLPILTLSGVIAGSVNGFLAEVILERGAYFK